MVKNLPTVERSTKIRFGKNVPDSDVQAENTIIFNASNTVISTPNSGSIYMSPVRFRDDFSDTNIVLMMYNRETGELSESGESASNLVGGQNLQVTTERGNTTSSTIKFINASTAFTTISNVGIINTAPEHTLSVGSNLYVNDTGSNVLVISGGVLLDGNLTVNGGITSIGTENLKIKDAIIELGQNNTSEDTTLDLGLIMTRPQSNVTVGFLESSKEIILGFTESSADSNVITPLTSEDINVHVYGRLYTESNVGVLNTDPIHTLDVGSNLYVDEFGSNVLVVSGNAYTSDVLSVGDKLGVKTTDPDAELHVVGNVYVSSDLTVDTDTFHVDASGNKVGIKTKSPDAELHVVGNAYVSSNLTVDTDTLHVDATRNSVGIETKNPQANLHVVGNVYVSSDLTVDNDTFHVDASGSKVGIKTKSPDAELHVVGNAYVSSNLTVDTDTLHVDAVSKRVGIETVNPDANLHVVGNVYVSSDLTVDTDTLHVDASDSKVGIKTKSPDAELHVVGNAYVSSNLTVDTDTFHVDSVNKRVGIETKNPTSNLHIVGNAYVTSNVTTDGTLNLKHPTTALITDLTSNVEVKLNQLANVVIDTTTLAIEDMLVYNGGGNWTNQRQNHTFLYAKAEETISKGDAVYATGTVGNNTFTVRKAQSNSSATMPALGLVYQDLALNEQGLIVTFGRADGINTDNFLTGETVYVSNVTAGELSNVKPYGSGDLIQNIGLVVKGHQNGGIVSVTGVGRSNDIPNASIVADEGDINYVYVNDTNNDLKKILPTNLLTQLQTLQQVTDTGNTTSNTIQFTNATTGLVTTSNLQVGSNISVAGLTDPQKKYLTMVNQDGFLQKSPVYVDKDTGVYIIEAAEAEFQGNLTLSGNTTILNSESVTISDRIFGVAANNSASQLDSGFMIEHQEGNPLEYANVALIYHADEHRFSISYTQNTFTDQHILHLDDDTHRMLIDLRGNVQISHNLDVAETLDVTGATSLASDLTVGGASNLFVDVSTSRVGINEASPTTTLDVNGDVRVQDTTDAASTTTGALVVSGGLGVASNIHSTNVYAGSHVGVGTDAASAPVHILVSGTGETTNGIYMKSAAGSSTNDAIVNLEVASDGGDAFVTWNASGGAAFAMGLDRSESELVIANSSSSLNTNSRLQMDTGGAVTLTNATNSTSNTTGAVIVSGGLGVAKGIYGATVNVTDETQASSNTTGAAIISGGLGVAKGIYGATVNVTDETQASSNTTGAVIVSGGLGVAKGIYGATVNVTDETQASSNTTGAVIVSGGLGVAKGIYGATVNVTDETQASSNTTGAVIVSGGLGVAKGIYGATVNVTDETQASSNTTGAAIISGGLGVAKGIYGATVNVTDETQASSNTTGAVIVSGGLGVAKGIYGATVNVTDTTEASSNTTGAVIVSGGLGVAKGIYGATATITDTTNATSSTTGAATVAGGIGVAKDMYVGEQAYVTGGLVTNMGAVTKKTYSFSNIVTAGGTAPEINVYFTSNVFYSKMTAQLVDDTDEVSTLVLEVAGGGRNGTLPTKNIKVGTKMIFGDATSTPWDSNVLVAPNRIMITPSGPLTNSGNCHMFMEYTSDVSSGSISNVQFDYDQHVVTFGY
jgi:enhancing lycopene biosynthesis protein 2